MDLNDLTEERNKKDIFLVSIKRCEWKNVCDAISKQNISLECLNFRQARSLLRFSVKFNHLTVFKKLISKNIHSSSFSKSLLWTAVRAGHTEIASELVRLGADLTRRHRGWTFLQKLAVKSNEPKNVQLAILMLDYGADMNALHGRHHKCAFYYAVRRGCIVLVKEFLNRGAYVRNYMLQKIYMTYVLNIDIYYKAVNIFVDEEIKQKRFVSLLWDLSKLNVEREMVDEKFVKVLDLVSVDELNKNSQMLVNLLRRRYFEMANQLIEHGVDCVLKKSEIQTMLVQAATCKQAHITKWLIMKKEANVNVSCIKTKRFVLDWACFHLSENNVKLLLECGANINLKDKYGSTCHFYVNDDKIGRLIMKQVALLFCKGDLVDERYFKKINEHPNTKNLYHIYLTELLKLKKNYIFPNMSLFSILIDVKLASFLFRNPNAIKNYNDLIIKSSFPLYYEDIDIAFQNAVHRKNALADQENAFCKAIFHFLPDLVIENIILYFYLSAVNC